MRVMSKLNLPIKPFPMSYFCSEVGYKGVKRLLSMYAVSTSEDYIWRLYNKLFVPKRMPLVWLRRYKMLLDDYQDRYEPR